MSLTGISAFGDRMPFMDRSSFSDESFRFEASSSSSGPFDNYRRFLYNDHVYNDILKLNNDAPKGLGTKIFASQVYHAKRVGLKYIKCSAHRDPSGSSNWVGYKVWPKMGYDGEIPQKYTDNLPKEIKEKLDLLGIKEPYKVSHLYSLPDNEGVKWWEEKGGSFDAYFDLEDDSYSMKTFASYLLKKKDEFKKKASILKKDPLLKVFF
jgi:hypothetical protein